MASLILRCEAPGCRALSENYRGPYGVVNPGRCHNHQQLWKIKQLMEEAKNALDNQPKS